MLILCVLKINQNISLTDLAKRAKAANLDAIHDTVHEMARDEARHGKAFAAFALFARSVFPAVAPYSASTLISRFFFVESEPLHQEALQILQRALPLHKQLFHNTFRSPDIPHGGQLLP